MSKLATLLIAAGALTLAILPARADGQSAGAGAGAGAVAAPVRVVRLYAAGSLTAAMTRVARAFEATAAPGALTVDTVFGASGLLRERIEAGEPAHVFASADVGHPAALAAAGRTQGEPRVFARNAMCAIARDGVAVDTGTLLDVLLAPATRVGMSTPKADPAGDYALKVYAAIDRIRPGAGAALEAKALRLTGGPSSPKAPAGRSLYGWVMSGGQADVFLTYCTNALLAVADTPSLRSIALPAEIAVAADYGLVVMKDAPAEATAFADYISSPAGQALLGQFGFNSPPR